MIETVFAIGLVLVIVIWIGLPLASPKPPATSSNGHHADALIESKEGIYRSILDLEFDHQTGKVSEDDYTTMRREAEVSALEILVELDSGAQVEDKLEREIAAARERLRRR